MGSGMSWDRLSSSCGESPPGPGTPADVSGVTEHFVSHWGASCSLHPRDCAVQNPSHCSPIAEKAVWVRLEAAAAAAEGAGQPVDAGKLMLRRCSCFTESSSGAGQELAGLQMSIPIGLLPTP